MDTQALGPPCRLAVELNRSCYAVVQCVAPTLELPRRAKRPPPGAFTKVAIYSWAMLSISRPNLLD
eukprot:6213799-Pleurochrysis_carterae.AAC.7